MVNNSYLRPVWAEIDLSKLQHNLREIQKCCPRSMIMAVVKANAYGHGAVECAKAALAAGASRLGVALVEEGIELRRAGIKAPIQILSEPPVDSIPLILKYYLIPTVCSSDLAIPLSIEAKKQKLTPSVHLKIDTGMNRLGVPADDALKMYRSLKNMPNIKLEGVFTHFAASEDPDHNEFTLKQVTLFNEIVEQFDDKSLIKHAANSGAAILHPSSHFDMVRIGISMYGLYPGEKAKSHIVLKPVMSLKSRVLMVKDVKKGEGVSYGLKYKAPEDTKIAVMPLGYADGYDRGLSGKGSIILKGKISPVAGTVCMDLTMFDIGPGSKVKKNDVGILFGEDEKGYSSKQAVITVDEIAKILGTINYEVVTGISKRVPRVFI